MYILGLFAVIILLYITNKGLYNLADNSNLSYELWIPIFMIFNALFATFILLFGLSTIDFGVLWPEALGVLSSWHSKVIGLFPRGVRHFFSVPIGMFCIFVLQVYAVLQLTNANFYEGVVPRGLYAIFFPLLFILEGVAIFLYDGVGAEVKIISVLYLIFAIDFLGDYIVNCLDSLAFLTIVFKILSFVLLAAFIMVSICSIISLGIAGNAFNDLPMFKLNNFFALLGIQIAVLVALSFIIGQVPLHTRTSSNFFWWVFMFFVYIYANFDLFEMYYHGRGWGFWTIVLCGLGLVTGFFAFISRFSTTERCPCCHYVEYTGIIGSVVGNPYTRTSSEWIHTGTTYEPYKKIEWYKEQVTVEVRQNKTHHYKCHRCGMTWKETTYDTLSKRIY